MTVWWVARDEPSEEEYVPIHQAADEAGIPLDLFIAILVADGDLVEVAEGRYWPAAHGAIRPLHPERN